MLMLPCVYCMIKSEMSPSSGSERDYINIVNMLMSPKAEAYC